MGPVVLSLHNEDESDDDRLSNVAVRLGETNVVQQAGNGFLFNAGNTYTKSR